MAKNKDNENVVYYLQKALGMELTAVTMYRLYSAIFSHLGFSKLAEIHRKEADEELEHVERLMGRLLFLGERPDVSSLGEIEYSEDVREIFERELAEENVARRFYEDAIRCAREEGDSGTRAVFEDLLNDEEGHILFLRQQLHLIETLGIEPYLQTHM